MSLDYKAFKEAAKEIDDLALEGFFGDEVKQMVLKRESIETADYLAECIEGWLKDKEQYGKEKVFELILLFFKIYTNAIESTGQEAVDCISSFFKGFPENPDTECLSSYTQYLVFHGQTRQIIQETKRMKNVTVTERRKLAHSILTTYQKGVELIGKILTILILLLQLSADEESEPMRIYNLSLANKIEKFEKLSNRRYDEISNSIYREIRNAESHLDMTYHPGRGMFIYKVKYRNKIKTKEMPVNKMLFDVFPKIGWLVQAFIYSGCFLVLAGMNPLKYRELTERVYKH